ncbi:MAG: hypothetical protein R2849_21240 [Thermomicrobiales bacterium]
MNSIGTDFLRHAEDPLAEYVLLDLGGPGGDRSAVRGGERVTPGAGFTELGVFIEAELVRSVCGD